MWLLTTALTCTFITYSLATAPQGDSSAQRLQNRKVGEDLNWKGDLAKRLSEVSEMRRVFISPAQNGNGSDITTVDLYRRENSRKMAQPERNRLARMVTQNYSKEGVKMVGLKEGSPSSWNWTWVWNLSVSPEDNSTNSSSPLSNSPSSNGSSSASEDGDECNGCNNAASVSQRDKGGGAALGEHWDDFLRKYVRSRLMTNRHLMETAKARMKEGTPLLVAKVTEGDSPPHNATSSNPLSSIIQHPSSPSKGRKRTPDPKRKDKAAVPNPPQVTPDDSDSINEGSTETGELSPRSSALNDTSGRDSCDLCKNTNAASDPLRLSSGDLGANLQGHSPSNSHSSTFVGGDRHRALHTAKFKRNHT